MLLRQAEEFRRLLDTGKAASQANLAVRYQLTRARVTQVMNLLRLAPEIQAYIRQLDEDVPERMVTEAGLRAAVAMAHRDQVAWAVREVPGFEDFVRVAS